MNPTIPSIYAGVSKFIQFSFKTRNSHPYTQASQTLLFETKSRKDPPSLPVTKSLFLAFLYSRNCWKTQEPRNQEARIQIRLARIQIQTPYLQSRLHSSPLCCQLHPALSPVLPALLWNIRFPITSSQSSSLTSSSTNRFPCLPCAVPRRYGPES